MKDNSSNPKKRRILWWIGRVLVSLAAAVVVIQWSESILLGIIAGEILLWASDKLFPQAKVGADFKLPGSYNQQLGVALAAFIGSLVFMFICVKHPEHSEVMTHWLKWVLMGLGLALVAYLVRWYLIQRRRSSEKA